jgi:hypothetical protein
MKKKSDDNEKQAKCDIRKRVKYKVRKETKIIKILK